MKTKYLLLVGLVLVFGSCSTAYRSGQTPDDVYYSPAPERGGYVTTKSTEDRESYSYNNDYRREDMEIRRGINDPRYRNNVMVDLNYGYNPYGYGNFNPYVYSSPYLYNSPYGYNYYSPYGYNNHNYYDPYYSNYFYSPYNNYYYSPNVYVTPKPQGIVTDATGPRRYNLGAYNNRTSVNRNNTNTTNGYRPATSTSTPIRNTTVPATNSNNNNNGSRVGNVIRRVFTPDNSNRVYRSNNNNNNYDNNNSNSNSSSTRSSSQPSGSSSSSGSSSAPTRTFRK